MFNRGKFDQSRFNLPGQESTDVIIRLQLAANMEAAPSIGEDIELHETMSGLLLAEVYAAAMLDASETAQSTINAVVAIKRNAILEVSASAAMQAETALSLDLFFSGSVSEELSAEAALDGNLQPPELLQGLIQNRSKLAANATAQSVTFTELLSALISTGLYDVYTFKVRVQLEPGEIAVIENDTYTAYNGGQSAIGLVSGDWPPLLSRAVKRIAVSGLASGTTEKALVYSERYL